jgi:hypothetical protein
MTAKVLMRERLVLSSRAFVEVAIWQLAQPLSGSVHRYKYRLAYIVDNVCVLRYDNEAGKGDHKHLDEIEVSYQFIDLDTLQTDFWADVDAWRK